MTETTTETADLRGRRISRTFVVSINWGYEYRDDYKDVAKEAGFRFDAVVRRWKRTFRDGKEAVRVAREWKDQEGCTATLRVLTDESYVAPPPPWASLERLRRRGQVEWLSSADLVRHLELGETSVVDALGDTIRLRYAESDLDADLQARRIEGQPDEVNDLVSYIICLDRAAEHQVPTPTPTHREQIARHIEQITRSVTLLRQQASRLAKTKRGLEKRLLACAAGEPTGAEIEVVSDADLDELVAAG